MKKILVCGDRNWTDSKTIEKYLIKAKEKGYDTVIEGEARGADSIARDIALKLGMKVRKFPAKWEEFGRSAGPIRNQQMLKEGQPDFVLAFHEDISKSKGTKNMLEIAKKAGVPTKLVSSCSNNTADSVLD